MFGRLPGGTKTEMIQRGEYSYTWCGCRYIVISQQAASNGESRETAWHVYSDYINANTYCQTFPTKREAVTAIADLLFDAGMAKCQASIDRR